jgi:hypothetical protein
MSDACLFCGQPEKSHKPSKSVDFICGRCVQLLLNADQADLKRAYEKALAMGSMGKAVAIKKFIEGEIHAETEEPKRNLERKRPLPAVRPSRDQVRKELAA